MCQLIKIEFYTNVGVHECRCVCLSYFDKVGSWEALSFGFETLLNESESCL